MIFQDKAAIVAAGLTQKHGLRADFTASSPFVDFLMQLLTKLLPMLLTCLPMAASAAQVTEAMKSLGPIQRWMLRRTICKHVGDPGSEDQLVGPLDIEIRKMISDCTEADVQYAMDEI